MTGYVAVGVVLAGLILPGVVVGVWGRQLADRGWL